MQVKKGSDLNLLLEKPSLIKTILRIKPNSEFDTYREHINFITDRVKIIFPL